MGQGQGQGQAPGATAGERRRPTAAEQPVGETVYDEHPTEGAEGAREPGEETGPAPREHPTDPAEGRDDLA